MDNRERYTTETRIEAARLFDAGFGFTMIAKHLGLPTYTLRDWEDSHKQGRLIGLGSMGPKKQYSTEVKLAAVERFLTGTSKAQVLEDFQISTRAVFNRWLIIYRDFGADGFNGPPRGRPKKNRDRLLETDAEKIYRLEMENEVLKKLIALRMQEKAALLAKRKQSRR